MPTIASDIHLRGDVPESRMDDYQAEQRRKWLELLRVAAMYPPLIISGDLFHRARAERWLVSWVEETIRDHLQEQEDQRDYSILPLVIPGQHDLPEHRMDKLADSALGNLRSAGLVDIVRGWYPVTISGGCLWVYGCPFGQTPPEPGLDWEERLREGSDFSGGPSPNDTTLLSWHKLVIDEPLWPGQRDPRAHTIVNRYGRRVDEDDSSPGQGFDFIFPGDNHQCVESRGILYNPGSMMRMKSDQANHAPRFYVLRRAVGGEWSVDTHYWNISPAEEVLSDRPSAVVRELDAAVREMVEEDSELDAELAATGDPDPAGLILPRSRVNFEAELSRELELRGTDPGVAELLWSTLASTPA